MSLWNLVPFNAVRTCRGGLKLSIGSIAHAKKKATPSSKSRLLRGKLVRKGAIAAK
jgi:hypothetical protein